MKLDRIISFCFGALVVSVFLAYMLGRSRAEGVSREYIATCHAIEKEALKLKTMLTLNEVEK